MKKFYSTLLFLILTWTSININAQTYISDKQEVYGTWRKSNSPYIIKGEAIVPKGESLKIEPGVIIKFKTGDVTDYSKSGFNMGMLRVKGSITAEGTANDLINFTRNGSDGNWGSIIIDNAENTCEFSYCLITYGENVYSAVSNSSVASYGCFSVHFSKCNLSNCIFYKNSFWSLFPANSTVNVTNCTFVQNTSYDIYNHVSDIIVKNTIMDDISNSSGTCEMYNCCVKTDVSSKGYKISNNMYGRSPEIVDPENYNFALKSGSPCIGAGQNGSDIGAITSNSGKSYASSSYSSSSSSSSGSGPTNISNRQEVYGTWTKSGSPYIIKGEAIVPAGKTLTIEPGVTIKLKTGNSFDYSKSDYNVGLLRVKGTIEANGTSNDLINFTRDGNDGYWGSIVLDNCANTSNFSYCMINYGYNTYSAANNGSENAYGSFSILKSECNLSHCVFYKNGFWTVYATNSTVNITNCSFKDTNPYGYDMYNSGSKMIVKNTIFETFSGTSTTVSISYSLSKNDISSNGCTMSNNIYGKNPEYVDPVGLNFALKSGSPCIGKGENGTDMGAITSSSSKSYASSSSSYSSSGSGPTKIADRQEVFGTWSKAGSPYIIEGEAIVPVGKTLTIEPGVTVKLATGSFAADYRKENIGMMNIKGKLDAQGTYDQRITFTRNGSEGNWGDLVFYNSTGNKLVCCNIEYPGVVSEIYDLTYTRGVTFINSSGLLKYTLIANSNDVTLQMNSSSPEIINCTFVNGSNTCIHPNAGTNNPIIKNTIV